MEFASAYVPLVNITRGDLIESVHFGAVAVCNHQGELIASSGDPELTTYLRSSSKPFQLMPLIESGGIEEFNLSDREISVMCASHTGSELHVSTVRAIQDKIHVQESDLLCGIHPPKDKESALALRLNNQHPSQNYHNCSGKHTGFLAQAVLNHLPKEDYINPDHPVQKRVIRTFSEMSHMNEKSIHIGIDGCSAPVFGIPLHNAAWAFASLADPQELSDERAFACRKICQAMTSYPEMVAGYGEFDTRLMQVGNGKIVAKGGAEGYQGIALMPGALSQDSPALGITFKISDGDPSRRACNFVAVEILRQLGALDGSQIEELEEFYLKPVTNWRGLAVGQMKSAFRLEFQ
jgi:L-asparaginase II